MKLKPILFSTPMVQAILDGRKTQTRRIIKSRHESGLFQVERRKMDGIVTGITSIDWDEQPMNSCTNDIKPKYQIGDILWVRETWQYTDVSLNDQPGYVYRASDTDWETLEGWRWKPSIHMPKEAARIFLKVTNVRAERLQDISEEDAIAEGIFVDSTRSNILNKSLRITKNYLTNEIKWMPAKLSFRTLWQSVYSKESWNENPFVWVYEFEITEKPENALKQIGL